MAALKRHISLLLSSLLLQIIFVFTLQAQGTTDQQSKEHTLIFKGEKIEYALQRLVEKTAIDLIYDPAIMTDHTVFKTARNEAPENILRMILDGSGLDFFQLSSGTYVLTKAPQTFTLHGNLSGQVIDQQTGEPLPGANIILTDAGGGAAASGTGFFNIPKLSTGLHEIIITYMGYKPARDTVWIPPGQTTSQQFSLSPEPVIVEPLVISGIQKRLPDFNAFEEKITASEVRTISGDAIKSLNAVSGIDFSLPLADFNIQGGNTGEHQLRLDGVPIYNPASMGRLLGAFSPYAIKNIRISKAGFEAPVGSQLSGIIDVKQDAGTTGDNNLLMQINPLNVNARFDHAFEIENGPEINFMVASRGNIWHWYQQPEIQQTLGNWDQLDPVLTHHLLQADSSDTFFEPRQHSYDITYYDLHAAARIKHNAFHQTYVSGYHGKNFLKTNLFSENIKPHDVSLSPGLFFSIDQYNWKNTMGKIEHQWLINSRFDASLGGYITRHSLDHSYSITSNVDESMLNGSYTVFEQSNSGVLERLDTGDQNAIMESAVELKTNYSASKNYHIRGGLSGKLIEYRFHLSDFYYNSVQSNEESFLVSGFLHNNFYLSAKTSLSVGSRMTFVPSRDLVFAEPRLSIKYDEPKTSIGYISLKLSGGIYRQFINQFDVSNVGPSSLVPTIRFWAPVDYTTTVPKAYHIAGDALWEPTENLQLRMETYYKWIPSRLALNYENLSQLPSFGQQNTFSDQQQFITQAKGYAYGAGLSVEKRIPSLNMMLKGSYQLNIARQRIPFRFNESYQPLPSSQPHSVSTSLNWKIIPRLTFLAEWEGIWGRSWGFRKAYYDYLSIRENRSFGKHTFDDPGSDTLPPFSQLNTGVSYKQPVKNSTLRFRLDLFNVLNHKNILNWWLSPHNAENGSIIFEREERTLTGFMPSLSIKFSY